MKRVELELHEVPRSSYEGPSRLVGQVIDIGDINHPSWPDVVVRSWLVRLDSPFGLVWPGRTLGPFSLVVISARHRGIDLGDVISGKKVFADIHTVRSPAESKVGRLGDAIHVELTAYGSVRLEGTSPDIPYATPPPSVA